MNGRLIMDPERREGCFARRETERARRAWYVSSQEDDARTWEEYRRREAGARAEEEVGRLLGLLDGFNGAQVFHAVEFQGPGLPHGDIDHLVLFEELQFAVVVESKYRLGEDVEERLVPLAVQYAEAVRGLLGGYTYPVLCQALVALRNDVQDEAVGRRWSDEGTALLCDAGFLAPSIQMIVNDFDRFVAGGWTFPEPSE